MADDPLVHRPLGKESRQLTHGLTGTTVLMTSISDGSVTTTGPTRVIPYALCMLRKYNPWFMLTVEQINQGEILLACLQWFRHFHNNRGVRTNYWHNRQPVSSVHIRHYESPQKLQR